jgi:hypothetical protein
MKVFGFLRLRYGEWCEGMKVEDGLVFGALEGVLKLFWDVGGRGLGWASWSVRFFKRYSLVARVELTGC